jgi:hypothetical protein
MTCGSITARIPSTKCTRSTAPFIAPSIDAMSQIVRLMRNQRSGHGR